MCIKQDNKYIITSNFNIMLKTALLIAVFAVNSTVFAADTPKIRELPSSKNSINSKSLKNDVDDIFKTKDITVNKSEKSDDQDNKTLQLKGGISELKATIGKSKLIRFDDPLKRISITNPSLVDIVLISPKEILLNGLSKGETSLILWGAKGDPVIFNLYVDNDPVDFMKEMKKICLNDAIRISFTKSNAKDVVISGHLSSVKTRAKIKELVKIYGYNLTDLTEASTPQVMLDLKVVEFTRSITNNSKAMPNFSINNTGEKPTGLSGSLSKLAYNLKIGPNGTYTGLIDIPALNLELTLGKDESEGIAKILAEPKLMTIDGQSASFHSGDQVPVISGSDEYGNLTTTTQNTGIDVTFDPTILEESGRILLKITPNISSYKLSGFTINGYPTYIIISRTTTTTVELEDKQTMIIGGLIQQNSNVTKTKIPYLSNLPVIGKMLGSSIAASSENNQTEIMIFVTPTIIKPDDVVDGV